MTDDKGSTKPQAELPSSCPIFTTAADVVREMPTAYFEEAYKEFKRRLCLLGLEDIE